MISTDQVKELRQKTGAGILDCKKALEESGGDIGKAIDYLRTAGIAKAEKKSGRDTSEGVVTSYIHPGSKLGVLLEVNCETDFVTGTDGFQRFVKDVAMHIAAAAPMVVRREDMPQSVLEHEKEIYLEQARQSGKPDHILEKIVGGKIDKFIAENVLLEQAFVKDPEKTVGRYLQETVGSLGENVAISRFKRFQLGEIEPDKGDSA
ncbi:MAG: translation elongation factor Ts [Fidelibacterota bacterium]|nr:MAG: translation elongation factor Ts [Candidatus Neomarinimicrobiota bacterium]